MARPRIHNAVTPISLDATDADTKSVVQEAKAKTAGRGSRTRKPGRVRRTEEDDAPNPQFAPTTAPSGIGASAASDYVAVQLPVVTEHKVGDVLNAPGNDTPSYKTFVVRSDEASLSPTQTAAIELLADMMKAYSVPQVAELIGVEHPTLYRWLASPVFNVALELRTRENFLSLGRVKAYHVYNRELNKASPSSRMMEQIAKTLGFFSDADTINLEVNVSSSNEQTSIDVGRDGPY
jgi:hypothetical protein